MAHRAPPGPRGPERQGILADDLTGAGDTALQFLTASKLAGGEVWILPELHDRVLSTQPPAQTSVLSVNTETRHLLPNEAATRMDRAARFLLRSGCTRFYQKIDSTLRGNLPTDLLQALRTLELELAIVAPAFPQAGRITVGGYQLVDGVPVEASVYGRDPITPVRHSHLPTLVAQHAGEEAIATLTLSEVMRGPEAVLSAIVQAVAKRKRVLVADAARPEDLTAIARGMALAPYRLLPVGSAGLARAMQPHALLEGRPPGARLLLATKPVLVVAGSLNPVTRGQVEALRGDAAVVDLDVRALLLGQADTLERTISLARQRLVNRQDVILTTDASEASLRRERALARDLAMGGLQVGSTVATALGQIAARLALELELAGLILAGGDTALSVCRALGGGRAAALGLTDELLPAIPLCRLDVGGRQLRVVTKSGGFGTPAALGDLVRQVKRDAAS